MGVREEALVQGAKDGDSACFGQLLELHASRAFGTAVAILASREDAEEVVQEAAFEAFRAIQKLKDEAVFGTWFTRIVVNRAINRLRRRQRERGRIVPIADWDPPTAAPDIEAAMDVTEAVRRLPDEHQAIVRLYYIEGYPTPEVARLLGKPEGTVRRRLSESYRLLRGLLQGET